MRRQTTVGLIAALITGTVVLGAAAAEGDKRAPFWPGLKPNAPAVVSEWYSDVPWHQKLGTFAGNQIDQALVLPYEVLGQKEKALCTTLRLSEEQCMIEIGVTNILGALRTDTPYDPNDTKIKGTGYCKDSDQGSKLPCIEVKLELSRWWAQPTGAQPPGRPVDLKRQTFGSEQPFVEDYPSGYVITDGSTYAPQMPWYMSHYCDSKFPEDRDAQDPVCYADYLSPMNSGFNLLNGAPTEWPKAGPWSVYPSAPSPPAAGNHCKPGLDTCTLALAGFDLTAVPSNLNDLQYQKYNGNLLTWFNRALNKFPGDLTAAALERHFPWSGKEITWESFVYPQALFNPFLGKFEPKAPPGNADPSGCDVTVDGPVQGNPPVPGKCNNTGVQVAKTNFYPRQCSLNDLAGAAGADVATVAKLRQCSLNYELHHNGFKAQWPQETWSDFTAASMKGNQYGRTSFLFAGVPGMQLPVSFYKDPASDSGLSIYEQVYNASIFSMYLPVANVADFKNAMDGRNYTDTQFYHTLLMSNHNESDPPQFADGIRGKVLWHNEYRMEGMYAQRSRDTFKDRVFAASFDPDPDKAKAPFHNQTCDGCHVRNGSGIPINTAGKLDKVLQEFMTDGVYNPYPVKDYTFTGQIRPMKLVFFDLRRDTRQLDASRYAEPLSFPAAVIAQSAGKVAAAEVYYNNKIMNYYGDSFHVTTPGYNYVWTYVKAKSDRMVVKDKRVNPEIIDPVTKQNKIYEPQQIKLDAFQTGPCVQSQIVPPPPNTEKKWPGNCTEINGTAITAAITNRDIGFMHLNGKRLGNLSAMEAIPNQAILGFRKDQQVTLGNKIAGEIIWNAGSRDGIGGKVQKCEDTKPKDLTQCFIGRFGWVGDRVSLEDQVANAAFVEMNMLTSEGYKKLYPKDDAKFPIRYGHPNCGPANKTCVESKQGNAELTERDVERMADYARWLGNPTRSELKVALPEVIAGEKLFRSTNCDTCHVNRKIEIVPDDTMLTQDFRDRLAKRVQAATRNAPKAAPFLSYIGTDLLMHDMGYLSQVADAPAGEDIRDTNGVVLRKYENYVQKIRTPALKGLSLNRFVTDSYKNTKSYDPDPNKFKLDAACDFLLHDGRACDAIEAAFLHDGPAIRKLGVIAKLNAMTRQQIIELRAFLYSL